MVVASTGGVEGLVSTKGWRASIQDTLDAFEELGSLDVENQKALQNFVNNLPDRASFASVKAARSRLLELTNKASEAGKDPLVRDAERVQTAMRRSMREAVRDYDRWRAANAGKSQSSTLAGVTVTKNFPPAQAVPLARTLEAADNAFIDLQRRQNRELYRGLIKMLDESDAGPAVMGKLLENGNPTVVRKLYEAIGKDSPEAEKFRSYALARLWEQSLSSSKETVGGRRVPAGRKLMDMLDLETKGPGSAMVKALFPPMEIRRIRKVANALARAQVVQSSTGAMAVQILEAGALGGAVAFISNPSGETAGGAAKTGAGIAISMKTLSSIMASKRMSKWLLDGFRPGIGKRGLGGPFLRIVSSLGRDEYVQFPAASEAEKQIGRFYGSMSRGEYGEFARRLAQLNANTDVDMDAPIKSKFGSTIVGLTENISTGESLGRKPVRGEITYYPRP